jgi:carbon monoxide dehydrogenase subunit G
LKISGSFALRVPQERAYTLLQAPDVLAQCIPGCESIAQTADNTYQMKMKLAIASLAGFFDGKVRITDQQPPTSFRLIVEGTGKIGFMKGEGLLQLAPDGQSTSIAYEGDVQVGGTIAAVGQRLIDMTSRLLIKRFFEKLTEITAARSGDTSQ